MDFNSSSPYPEGVISFLDTDLYKLTMQCAVLKYYKDVPVTYSFTNRTPEKKLSRQAFVWLDEQIKSTSTTFGFLVIIYLLTFLQSSGISHCQRRSFGISRLTVRT
jgi:nicotinic acid phosphoribosyltransferase